jgi:hypothetical protein
MSSRTLQRRITDEGASLRQLLSETRQELPGTLALDSDRKWRLLEKQQSGHPRLRHTLVLAASPTQSGTVG